MRDRVEFYRHNIGEEEIHEAASVLRTLFLTTGNKVARFEESLARYTGIPHVTGLTSATAALHLALLAHNIGPGDEVITTPMSFIASSNAILMAGARPVFVDVEPGTGNIDAGLIEEAIGEKTRAILPVHLYGVMVDMKKIRAIADRYGLIIIEDAAHALESIRDGVRVGHLGDACCFSFYATKSITSGEGGALATFNPEKSALVRMLRSHGMESDAHDRYTVKYRHYDMPILGWKYNMDNIQGALLTPQVEKIERYRLRREEIALRYEKAFAGLEGIDFPRVPSGAVSGRHLFTIWIGNGLRDSLLLALQQKNVGVAVNYRAIHLMTYYQATFGYRRGMYPQAERIGDETISIPLYPLLTDEEVEYVIHAVTESVRELAEKNSTSSGAGNL